MFCHAPSLCWCEAQQLLTACAYCLRCRCAPAAVQGADQASVQMDQGGGGQLVQRRLQWRFPAQRRPLGISTTLALMPGSVICALLAPRGVVYSKVCSSRITCTHFGDERMCRRRVATTTGWQAPDADARGAIPTAAPRGCQQRHPAVQGELQACWRLPHSAARDALLSCGKVIDSLHTRAGPQGRNSASKCCQSQGS